MTELLEVRELTKKYSATHQIMGEESEDLSEIIVAVDSVNFKVGRGETVGIVGQSGSGKTTVGRLVVRLESPTSGSVLFDGEDVHRLRGKRLVDFRAKVQMIFQDPYASLDPHLTVKGSLQEPLVVHGIRNHSEKLEKIVDALAKVGLTPPERFLNLHPHQLSGGQRQRTAIARSLILEPQLIVADEPVSMLDVSVSAEILNLMLDLKKSTDIAYLFITHNLAHAAYFCDRIVVMNRGRIIEEGPTTKVLENPSEDYTKLLIASVPSCFPEQGTIGA